MNLSSCDWNSPSPILQKGAYLVDEPNPLISEDCLLINVLIPCYPIFILTLPAHLKCCFLLFLTLLIAPLSSFNSGMSAGSRVV